MRAENIERIEHHAKSLCAKLNTDVFASREAWRAYSVAQLKLVERVAEEVGLGRRLHLWPDKALGSKAAVSEQSDPTAYQGWLGKWWERISEWPQ